MQKINIFNLKRLKRKCDVTAPDSVKEPGSGSVESPANSSVFRMLTGRYGAVLQPQLTALQLETGTYSQITRFSSSVSNCSLSDIGFRLKTKIFPIIKGTSCLAVSFGGSRRDLFAKKKSFRIADRFQQ